MSEDYFRAACVCNPFSLPLCRTESLNRARGVRCSYPPLSSFNARSIRLRGSGRALDDDLLLVDLAAAKCVSLPSDPSSAMHRSRVPRFAVRNAASRWYTSRSATASTRSRSRPKMTRRSSASVALVTMTASGWSAATSVRIGCTRAASASTTARRSLRTFLSPSSSASSEPAQPNHSTRLSAERGAALHRCCKKIRPAAIEVQMPKIYYWGMASPRR